MQSSPHTSFSPSPVLRKYSFQEGAFAFPDERRGFNKQRVVLYFLDKAGKGEYRAKKRFQAPGSHERAVGEAQWCLLGEKVRIMAQDGTPRCLCNPDS